jgi:hypothetical protein
VSQKIKNGILPRQGKEEQSEIGISSSQEIAGQILAPAVAAANNP